ncbi:NACHT domain-containing protein [Lusitaniella coriacea]|uniref:NACHT domain-containing protein n=1 Tax=Lusitaniella coriacea TaxID=1983105 RepID=UPI003CF6B161
MKLWKSIWKVGNTKIQIPWTDAVEGVVEAGQNVIELAQALSENKDAKALAPLIGRIDSLLDVLDSPLLEVAGAGLPFIAMGTKLLKFIVEETQQEPTLEMGIALVAQAAYLESLRQFLRDNNAVREKLENTPASKAIAKQIKRLGEKLELNGQEIQFDDKDARKTLICFHDSPLAGIFNPILAARLHESGLTETEAKRISERISRSTHRYMKEALAEVRDDVPRLAALYGEGWLRDLEQYSSLDNYLEDNIAKKPQEKVFDEEFSFQDVYVPLEVKPVDKDEPAQNIEEWARTVLLDEKKQGRVLFIQGGPGRGKSVFCRMFADWVRRELHPIYTPILIRLRDITAFENDFDRTLSAAIGTDFVNDKSWLTDRNTRFLFLLDGFDELLLERGANANLRNFIEQVEKFQQRCEENPERQHRVLITGRPFALFGIEHLMPKNLERVGIILMGEEIQNQWLAKWQTVVASDAMEAATKTQEFREFLENEHCPEAVKILAKEPLLLYLLAAMHRDGEINAGMFDLASLDEASASSGEAKVSPSEAKVLIYQKALDWVLNKQREHNLNQKITELEPGDLRTILAEAGLCVVQSGRERARISTLEDRLVERGDAEIKDYIEKARNQNQENALKNALATFYLKSASGKENCVEFFHKSFGEFLCAERMVESFADWAEVETKKRRSKPQYRLSSSELEWQIYDLFGYGALTVEIVEYVRALLEQQDKPDSEAEKIDVVALFNRLHEFYLLWCAGEFIEQTTETLPQKKARQLQAQEIARGQREVNIYTGLNVLILLLELHRYGQKREALKEKLAFYPCGQPGTEDFDDERLLRIIGYSKCLGADSFREILGKFLEGTFLILTNLRGADLFGVDLFGADLTGADLCGADLIRADLYYADLCGARFFGTNLCEADLCEADLRGANLRGTGLSDADLRGADLRGADLRGANLSDLKWDSDTRWANILGLHEATNVPDTLAQKPQFAAAVALSRGVSLVQQGDVDAALAAYQEAQHLDPKLKISARFWNSLCWDGCLHSRAPDVLFAGEKAVELASELDKEWLRDTRGLARALTEDKEGAIEDFQAVLDSGYFDDSEKEQQQRQGWLDALRAGDNPFTPEVLAALREEK